MAVDVVSVAAVLTGFEPATSGLTGRRALQTAPQDPGQRAPKTRCTPNGIRTRVTALKGRRPRPLDDGGWTDQGLRRLAGRLAALTGSFRPREAANPNLQACPGPRPRGPPARRAPRRRRRTGGRGAPPPAGRGRA